MSILSVILLYLSFCLSFSLWPPFESFLNTTIFSFLSPKTLSTIPYYVNKKILKIMDYIHSQRLFLFHNTIPLLILIFLLSRSLLVKLLLIFMIMISGQLLIYIDFNSKREIDRYR